MPVPWEDHHGTAAAGEWSQPELRRQAMCTAESRAGEMTQALWRNTEECEWIPDIGQLEFDFYLICDCALIFLFGLRKYLNG